MADKHPAGWAARVKATTQNFSLRKHNLIQAILSVNDLFYLAVPVVASLFLEDVTAWLELHDIRPVNRPSLDLAEALEFSWVDTKEVRPTASKFYALLNDETGPPSGSIVDALRSYDIVPVLWSQREEARQELAA